MRIMLFLWGNLAGFELVPGFAQLANQTGIAISPLRITGILCGGVFLVLVVWCTSRGIGSRLNNLLGVLFALGLITVSAFPSIAGTILAPFSFSGGEGYPRLIGLLVVSVLFLIIYQFIIASNISESRRELTAMVRSLAIDRYLSEVGPRPAPDVLVIVPAYNEEGSLAAVLSEIPAAIDGMNLEAVVVVDGATDSTEAVARQFGVPAVHYMNRGQTAAIATGYEIARRRGAKIVATIDADGQMVPAELERVISPVADRSADLVSGSRVLGTHRAESMVRVAGVHFFSLIISILIGQRITDSSIGLRAIRVSSLASMRFLEERFGAAELLVEAHRRGLKLKEVPVTIQARKAGTSRKPASLRYGFGFGWAMLRSWLR